jgi:hypothetical protein
MKKTPPTTSDPTHDKLAAWLRSSPYVLNARAVRYNHTHRVDTMADEHYGYLRALETVAAAMGIDLEHAKRGIDNAAAIR